jgi:hypothetical protein
LSASELNIRSFYAPLKDGKRTVYFDFNFKINIEDYVVNDILNELEGVPDDIDFEIKFYKSEPDSDSELEPDSDSEQKLKELKPENTNKTKNKTK